MTVPCLYYFKDRNWRGQKTKPRCFYKDKIWRT